MCRLAGERTDGTILWMADEKANGEHIAPTITKAAAGAGRPAPRIVAGVPVCLCGPDEVDAAKARANRVLSEAEISPNYQKLLDRGRSEEHTSELQSLMRISYAVSCLTKKHTAK